MTFAEIFIFVLLVVVFFIILNPIRRRIEHYIYKTLHIPKKNIHNDVPLTPNDYTKKEDKKNE